MRCIIQDRVENKPSEAIVKEAHRLAGIPIEKGMTWTRAGHPEMFHAILGSQNGYGVVYMLKDLCAALRTSFLLTLMNSITRRLLKTAAEVSMMDRDCTSGSDLVEYEEMVTGGL